MTSVLSGLESVKGRNEARVVRDIAQLLVLPAKVLALNGAAERRRRRRRIERIEYVISALRPTNGFHPVHHPCHRE
jgi:hypothetical protein